MNLELMMDVDEVLRKYTGAYAFFNDKELNLALMANVSDTEKELILNDLDMLLPLGIIFNHEYNNENGKLNITFKEIRVDING